MSLNLNLCQFAGNFVRDPELKQTQNSVVVHFTIAVNGRPYKKNGEQVRDTSFVKCVAWAEGAERIAEYFKKGDPIYVQSVFQENKWTDNDGKPHSYPEFRVTSFEFNSPKKGATPAKARHSEEPETVSVADEDLLPF